jgi:GGDEF domain-containing protein
MEEYDLALGCSIGVAIFPVDHQDFLSLMDLADQAMYAAKRDGKNKVILSNTLVSRR